MAVKTAKLHYTSDCQKCGGRLMTDGVQDYTVECAYPEDCPTKKLNKKSEFKRIHTLTKPKA